jgi:hypothetical protein
MSKCARTSLKRNDETPSLNGHDIMTNEEYVVEELEERHAPQPPSSFPQQPGGKVVLVPVGSKA